METDQRRNGNLKIGNFKHGHGNNRKPSREYISWRAAKQRCFYPKRPSFKHYGGRGITMCPHWKSSFPKFLADMGLRPEKTFLERVDNDKGYLCPICLPPEGNCCWATRSQQNKNQRSEFREDRSKWMVEWWKRQSGDYVAERLQLLFQGKEKSRKRK